MTYTMYALRTRWFTLYVGRASWTNAVWVGRTPRRVHPFGVMVTWSPKGQLNRYGQPVQSFREWHFPKSGPLSPEPVHIITPKFALPEASKMPFPGVPP